MLQAKPVVNNPRPGKKTVGGKIVSVLRYPLFTIPFQKPAQAKRQEEAEKPIEQKKAVKRNQNRPMTVNGPYMPVTPRNVPPVKNTASYIFTPERNREEFEKALFILRACDKRGRAFTNVLHVEGMKNGSRLIGTDGKRMHVAEIGARIKPGDYKPAVAKSSVRLGKPVRGIIFPNWERVVPADVTLRGCINLENNAAGENCRSLTRLTGERVNPDYLADLTKKPWAVYAPKEKRKALLLKEYGANRKTFAVIMPLAS